MGLDAHVGDYKSPQYMSEHLGSCGGYHHWRSKIARVSGFELDEMDSFGGGLEWTDEPFQLVLNHSDCDGEYQVDVLPKLMEELKEIRKLGVDDYDQSEKFIEICEHAIRVGLPVKFG